MEGNSESTDVAKDNAIEINAINNESKSSPEEYIIALRSEFITNKINDEVNKLLSKKMLREDLDNFVKIYKQLCDSFDKKFSENKFYNEYKCIIENTHSDKISRLNAKYIEYESEVCGNYISSVLCDISHDDKMVKIRNDTCSSECISAFERINEYKKECSEGILKYGKINNITDENTQWMQKILEIFFGYVEKMCNTIFEIDVTSTIEFEHLYECFVSEISEFINEIKVTSFEFGQNENFDEKANNIMEKFLSHKIESNKILRANTCGEIEPYIKFDMQNTVLEYDMTKILLKNFDAYRMSIENSFEIMWRKDYEEIMLGKNRIFLMEIIDNNFEIDTKMVENDPLEIIKISEQNYMDFGAYKKIIQIIDKCKCDIFYFGHIYCKNNMSNESNDGMSNECDIANNITEDVVAEKLLEPLQMKFGIFTRENVPKYLILNEKILQSMFVSLEYGKCNVYVFAPNKSEMNEMFVKVVDIAKKSRCIEDFFGISLQDMIEMSE